MSEETREVLMERFGVTEEQVVEYIAFVKWVAEHPDIGDGFTACEREMGIQQQARALLYRKTNRP